MFTLCVFLYSERGHGNMTPDGDGIRVEERARERGKQFILNERRMWFGWMFVVAVVHLAQEEIYYFMVMLLWLQTDMEYGEERDWKIIRSSWKENVIRLDVCCCYYCAFGTTGRDNIILIYANSWTLWLCVFGGCMQYGTHTFTAHIAPGWAEEDIFYS